MTALALKAMTKARIFGIDRHRIKTDGPGITTLVGLLGCPLKCKYCINKSVYTGQIKEYTVEKLFNQLVVDDLYFDYTGGGICFGGHEPLNQSNFIIEFIEYCKNQGVGWKFGLETSLSPVKFNKNIVKLVDYMIIDIKTLNPSIYQEYTGKLIDNTINNLEYVIQNFNMSNILVRVPIIPGFTSKNAIEYTVNKLTRNYGFKSEQLDIFEYSMLEA